MSARSWRLGLGFVDAIEREREGKGQERGEEVPGDLIRARGGLGRTRTAGATGRAPWMGRGRYRRRKTTGEFPQNPLPILFLFLSGPFSILFSVFN